MYRFTIFPEIFTRINAPRFVSGTEEAFYFSAIVENEVNQCKTYKNCEK